MAYQKKGVIEMVTKTFRIKSDCQLGKTPVVDDFSNAKEGIRIMKWDWDYAYGCTLVQITRDTAGEVDEELRGQLSDGAFENHDVESVEEVKAQYKLTFDNRDYNGQFEDYTISGDFAGDCEPDRIQFYATRKEADDAKRGLIEANSNLADGLLVVKCDQRGTELYI